MPQSFASVPLHIIFSTKNRQPYLTDELEQKVAEYISSTVTTHRAELLRMGGMSDHVHLLVRLGRTVSIADLVKSIKTASSRWIHDTQPSLKDFGWQTGYAAFAVSESNLMNVEKYILNQKVHHEKVTFQDEYRKFLKKHKLDYDEQYLWD